MLVTESVTLTALKVSAADLMAWNFLSDIYSEVLCSLDTGVSSTSQALNGKTLYESTQLLTCH